MLSSLRADCLSLRGLYICVICVICGLTRLALRIPGILREADGYLDLDDLTRTRAYGYSEDLGSHCSY